MVQGLYSNKTSGCCTSMVSIRYTSEEGKACSADIKIYHGILGWLMSCCCCFDVCEKKILNEMCYVSFKNYNDEHCKINSFFWQLLLHSPRADKDHSQGASKLAYELTDAIMNVDNTKLEAIRTLKKGKYEGQDFPSSYGNIK